jgi:hypothetical protein
MWAQVISRFGWILVLVLIVGWLIALIPYIETWPAAAKFLSLVAFTISLAAAESRLGWPRRLQRPIVGAMWAVGSLLMFVAGLAKELHNFEVMTLILIFSITLKEVGNWFGPGHRP